MLHVTSLEEIETLLLKVPTLVTRLDEHDPAFLTDLKSWFADVEQAFSSNMLSAASEIAACRGTLIAVERRHTGDAAGRGRMGVRRFKEARATQLLNRATEVIAETIRSRRAQVDEASRVLMQVVAAAEQLDLIPTESGQSHRAYLKSVLQAIANRAELSSLVVHVIGLLGETDTLIVLDRSIAAVQP